MIQKQYLSFKNYTLKIETYNFFVNSIQRDLERAQAISLSDKTLQLAIGSNNFIYEFEDTLTIRSMLIENQKPDTFNIIAKLGYTSFEKEYRAKGLIDEMEIQVKLFDKLTTLPLQKWYSAQELMNHEH